MTPSNRRHDRLQIRPSPDERNTLQHLYSTVPFWRVVRNWLVIYTARYLPWLHVKRRLYQAVGVTIGEDVSVGLAAVFDVFFPEEITIGANSIIGYNTVILAHEYLQREWRKGPVVIGRNVVIGANCTILPGIIIGDGAVVSAMSLVNRDVSPGATVGGVPVRVLAEAESGERRAELC
ncbi:MAG: acyltransferase [Anaerolineae bacterium]|jgi:acetyltransferase-like isoleucine patch superfamily enzyme|uniref:acyltransferase n=1 Tax=Candidatus Amarolinea dominans TaxID=3140696 RepID=UPI001D21D4A8|nr:acyltransferase [Anaerolineae bacterium]MBK7199167.1 acyltransferase [Anaerolineae bacterium]MBK9095915.1 acyltransferase [Anaerolineae bacterium]MBK9229969.1 acyltransferase [Anaerolineae bacterium]